MPSPPTTSKSRLDRIAGVGGRAGAGDHGLHIEHELTHHRRVEHELTCHGASVPPSLLEGGAYAAATRRTAALIRASPGRVASSSDRAYGKGM
jgi:hypothetical protein